MAKSTKLPKKLATEFHKKLKDLRDFMEENGIRIAYDCTGNVHEFAVLPDGFWPVNTDDEDYDEDSAEYDLSDFEEFDPSYFLTPFDSGDEVIQKM